MQYLRGLQRLGLGMADGSHYVSSRLTGNSMNINVCLELLGLLGGTKIITTRCMVSKVRRLLDYTVIFESLKRCSRVVLILFESDLFDEGREDPVTRMKEDHATRKEYRALGIVCSLNAPLGDVLFLQAGFPGVGLAHGASVDGRRAEFSLDRGRNDIAELDLGVLDREGLVQDEGGTFCGCVDRTRGCRSQ